MIKINLDLKVEEIKKNACTTRTFKVLADEPTKKVVREYIKKVGNKVMHPKGYFEWNLENEILNAEEFIFFFWTKEEVEYELKLLKEELQNFANKNETKTKEHSYRNKPKVNESNVGSILKPKEESKKYTGYTVKLDLTDVENTFRNLIEEYTTELNKPKYTKDVDFVKMLDSIKEAIQAKKVTVVETMGFISDLNDYLTDLVAGIYNA